jgi:hypothetical protein
MNTRRDHLDDAIDHVAARLVHAADDATLSTRIVAALPERSGWRLSWLMPRLAVTAALAIGASLVVLRTFDDRSTNVLETFDGRSTDVQLAVAVPEHRPTEPAASARRTIGESSSDDRRTVDRPDFERSLPALEGAGLLTFGALAPLTLPEDALLTLEPLAISDLPLTAETISPR